MGDGQSENQPLLRDGKLQIQVVVTADDSTMNLLLLNNALF